MPTLSGRRPVDPGLGRPPDEALPLSGWADDYGTGDHLARGCKAASFGLAMLLLRQAWRLGGLPRALPVPFRGSYFTAGLHPPTATPQRRPAGLYQRGGYWAACPFAHSSVTLRDAPPPVI